jgi:hypothetical protein
MLKIIACYLPMCSLSLVMVSSLNTEKLCHVYGGLLMDEASGKRISLPGMGGGIFYGLVYPPYVFLLSLLQL